MRKPWYSYQALATSQVTSRLSFTASVAGGVRSSDVGSSQFRGIGDSVPGRGDAWYFGQIEMLPRRFCSGLSAVLAVCVFQISVLFIPRGLCIFFPRKELLCFVVRR
ncbi:unnamed protein product, partial [Phaeothamnion confervicola]